MSSFMPLPPAKPSQKAKQSFCSWYSLSCNSIPLTMISFLPFHMAKAIAHVNEDVKYLSGFPKCLTFATIPNISENGYWTDFGMSQ